MTVSNRVACEPHQRIIFPLDNMDQARVYQMIDLLAPHVGAFKVGLELIMRLGVHRAIEIVSDAGAARVMLDAKFHDIPKTVGKAVAALAEREPWLCTVHASGHIDMLTEAVKARGTILVAGVTVLTSLDERACTDVYGEIPAAKVAEFAGYLVKTGCQAIVCSPLELETLRDVPGADALIRVIPGIRPEWSVAAGQTRFTTPAMAIKNGADYLVIGDPINSAASPVDAAKRIADEINEANAT